MADITSNEFVSGGFESLNINGRFDHFLFGDTGADTFNKIGFEGLRVDVVFGPISIETPEPVADPPVVVMTPDDGSQVSAGTTLQAQVIGEDVEEVLVWVAYPDLNVVELAFDGVAFTPNFNRGSTQAVLDNTQTFNVKRNNGWPGSPRFSIRARNTAGAVNL